MPGWSIFNIQPGPGVDFVGNCADLSSFADGTVEEIYASHVHEHLSYRGELQRALKEAHRVLRPGGILRTSVPDFQMLCHLFVHPRLSAAERKMIIGMTFGGQVDAHDFHKVGLTYETLGELLVDAGFTSHHRVPEFGLFKDCSTIRLKGTLISLNVVAVN